MKSKNKNLIGGEKVFPLSILFLKKKNDIFSDYQRKFKNFFINYTFGGYFSLLSIIHDLDLAKNSYVLLPSYLCPSILKPFQDRCIKYVFYRIDANLSPDFKHIEELLNKDVKAVLFIDYMGKSQIENVLPLHSLLSKNGVKIIQDCVQTINIEEDKIYGDYVFNSFRKTTPFEGSIIISKKNMHICFEKNLPYKFIFYKRMGQVLRYFHIHFNIFKPTFFLRFLEKAEELYQASVIYKFPRMNKYLIEKIDFKQLIKKHEVNYNILMEMLKPFVPRTLQCSNFEPFAFFMVVNKRNSILKFLHENGIFCPVHWAIPNEINKATFRESHDISAKALTIPLADINESNINDLKLSLEKVML